MITNKIMVLTIGILTLGGTAGAQTLRTDNGPAERPPASYKAMQYVDSKGCVYIRAGQGVRITWVPRVNRKRQVFCSPKNKPSLSATQLAAITGKPASRLVKSAVPVTVRTTQVSPETTVQTPNVPKKKPAQVAAPKAKPPAKIVTAVPKRQQAIRPANAIKARQAGGTYQQAAVSSGRKGVVPNRVDHVHGITLHAVVLDADISARGDAQMALVWSNTVPRKLVQQSRSKLVASMTTSTKSEMR